MTHSARRLMPFHELQRRSLEKGLRVDFVADDYANNQIDLPWTCIHCGLPVFDSWAHLETRGCPHCRKNQRDQARCSFEFGRAKSALWSAAHEMLSSVDDYKRQKSLLHFLCGVCGQVHARMAVKILTGALGCASQARLHKARVTRGAYGRETLLEAAAALRWEVCGDFDYKTLKKTMVIVKRPGKSGPEQMLAQSIVNAAYAGGLLVRKGRR